MIYFVTKQQELFESNLYSMMTVEDSLKEINTWNKVQLDTETTGKLKILDYLRAFIRL